MRMTIGGGKKKINGGVYSQELAELGFMSSFHLVLNILRRRADVYAINAEDTIRSVHVVISASDQAATASMVGEAVVSCAYSSSRSDLHIRFIAQDRIAVCNCLTVEPFRRN